MKNLFLVGLLYFSCLAVTNAQTGNTYQDDIYFNGSDARKQSKANRNNPSTESTDQRDSEQSYDRPDNQNFNENDNNGYAGDSYMNYDDDNDYTYATRFNRFGYNSFYNRPYFSTFINPYWYNPYWVDPYWGWNPWMRSGISVSFGGGPYWGSNWGWQSWYGYNGFNSFYYPSAYTCGWGNGFGWGGGYGWGGGFYGNYWNGYYAGIYGGGGGFGNRGYSRNITYGPRYSMNSIRNNTMRTPVQGSGRLSGGGLKTTGSGRMNDREAFQINGNNDAGRQNMNRRYDAGNRPRENRFSNDASGVNERQMNGERYGDRNRSINNNENYRGSRSFQQNDREVYQQQGRGRNFQNRGERMQMNRGDYQRQQAPMREQNYQQSAPQRSTPAFNGGGGGSRSGGFNGGGGGGSRSGGFGGGGGSRGGGGRR